MPKVTGVKIPKTSPLTMQRSDPLHMLPANTPKVETKIEGTNSFGSLLQKALGQVEKIDAHAKTLTNKAVYDPDAVEAHEILIAAEKSRFTLNLTKSLADSFVRTFRELTSPR